MTNGNKRGNDSKQKIEEQHFSTASDNNNNNNNASTPHLQDGISEKMNHSPILSNQISRKDLKWGIKQIFLYGSAENFCYMPAGTELKSSLGFSLVETLTELNNIITSYLEAIYAATSQKKIEEDQHKKLKFIADQLTDLRQLLEKYFKDGNEYSFEKLITELPQYGNVPRALGLAVPDKEEDVNSNSQKIGSLTAYLCKQQFMQKFVTLFNTVYAEAVLHKHKNEVFEQLQGKMWHFIQKNSLKVPPFFMFSYYNVFRKKLKCLVEAIKNKDIKEALLEQLALVDNDQDLTEYERYKELSKKFYGSLRTTYETNAKLDIEKFPDKWRDIKDVMIVIAYLNSSNNAFSRQGVFKETSEDKFYLAALKEFEERQNALADLSDQKHYQAITPEYLKMFYAQQNFFALKKLEEAPIDRPRTDKNIISFDRQSVDQWVWESVNRIHFESASQSSQERADSNAQPALLSDENQYETKPCLVM